MLDDSSPVGKNKAIENGGRDGSRGRQGRKSKGAMRTLFKRSVFGTAISLSLWVAVWFAITNLELVDTEFLSPPQEIVLVLFELFADGYAGSPLLTHFFVSLGRTLLGFGLAVLVAVPVGLFIGMNQTAYIVLNPVFSVLRPIPTIAFIPLVILWFGIGETSKILVIFVSAFLFIVLNVYSGVLQVSAEYKRVAQNLGAKWHHMFFYVILPGAAPSIMTGVKTGLAISWAVVVAAELIAAQQGLGYVIMDAATFFRIPVVYVGVLLIGVVGFLLESGVSGIERKFIHWRGR